MALRPQLYHLVLLCVLFLTVRVHAKCSHPSVRREWRTISKKDRAAWISAVQCLQKLPHDPALTPSVDLSVSLIPPVNTSSSFWDDISYMHMDLSTRIHSTGYFLPWHRIYVWGLENAMKTKCGYTGAHPYWNWTTDAADFYHSTILDNDTESGFGGWGDPDNDYQITTGGFAEDFMLAYPVPHNIRRNFTLQPLLGGGAPGPPPPNPGLYINTTFTESNLEFNINSFVGDEQGFQGYMESLSGVHPGPHLILGGEMLGDCPSNAVGCVRGNKWSPNDPLFFMHHAMIDKVWSDWQNKHPSNFYSFVGGAIQANATTGVDYPTGSAPMLNFSSVIPNDGLLWDNVTIWDVMDTKAGPLCYIYQ